MEGIDASLRGLMVHCALESLASAVRRATAAAR
jgi:hypothetical protein